MKEKFILKFDEKIDLIGYKWTKENMRVRGVMQIAHGMAEHILRYNEFAEEMASKGIIVIGVDLYGHGESLKKIEDIGIIEDYDFMDAIIKSIKLIRDEFTDLFKKDQLQILFAHSMGSMVSQRYIELYPDDFKYIILSGTDIGGIKYRFAKIITKLSMNIHGKISYSKMIDNMTMGAFAKKYSNDHPRLGWLSVNSNNRRGYEKDPLCGALFPTNYYYSLAKLLIEAKKSSNLIKINKEIKIFLISGSGDPVSNYGKSTIRLCKIYKHYGIKAKYKIYANARHEVHNESKEIKNELFEDILKFIK